MLVNYVFNTNIHYNDDLSYINLFVISLLATYTVYAEHDMVNMLRMLFVYVVADLCFLPITRIESIIHHLIVVGGSLTLYTGNFERHTINAIALPLIKTELSSLFLCSKHFLKKIKNTSNVVENIYTANNIVFMVAFFRYRCYGLYIDVINNDYIIQTLLRNEKGHPKITTYGLVYGLFILQLYWFSLMLRIVYRKYMVA